MFPNHVPHASPYTGRERCGPGTTLFDGEPLRPSRFPGRDPAIRRDATLERTGVFDFLSGCLYGLPRVPHRTRRRDSLTYLSAIDPRNRGLRVSTVRVPLMRSPTARPALSALLSRSATDEHAYTHNCEAARGRRGLPHRSWPLTRCLSHTALSSTVGASTVYSEPFICMSSYRDLLTDSRTEGLLDLCSDVER